MKRLRLIIALVAVMISTAAAWACSRVVYLGDNNNIILVGRTLDWRTPIPTNLYVYPAGIAKESMPDGNRLQWTSRYGTVLAVSYDGGVTEGMNEVGLSMNSLFCKTAVYPTVTPDDSLPIVSNAVLVSFFLDNFATVDEVDTWLQSHPFAINSKAFDGGTVSLLHWALTDRSGDTLVMEFVNGHLNTYRGRDLTVLTNDPTLKSMQAINKYWENIGGMHALPGTVSSPDRFVRASYFIKSVPTDFSYDKAYAAITSIMGTVSVPFGYKIEGEPNVSSTQWTSVSDITGGKYYFRFADSYGAMWIDLGRLRLNPGAPILKLDTTNHFDLTGCVNNRLVPSPAFTPMW